MYHIPFSDVAICAIYGILVRVCGFADHADNAMMLRMYLLEDYDHKEFRFQGALGFGGKFYSNGGRWYVGCYREDDTPERLAMIAQANRELSELHEREVAALTTNN